MKIRNAITASSKTAPANSLSPSGHAKRNLFKIFFGKSSPESDAEGVMDVEGTFQKSMSRRSAIKSLTAGAAVGGTALAAQTSPLKSGEEKELAAIRFKEYFRKNYRLMNKEERMATLRRLERKAQLQQGVTVKIKDTPAQENVLFGYAFNISKCRGYMDCIEACIQENNQDRRTQMQYIKIFEFEKGKTGFESGNSRYYHEVPVEGHYYLGTQCFHCDNPPCTKVCPVGATWKERDGIVVVDYDWCIGCRYCEAACPYFGRRFNWSEPEVPREEINANQHYLGNRMRKKGVMEKCTFCVQRSRDGKLPACVEACPTGARVFGNLLDPNSEIRYVLENKKVFRLKEELGTEPKFWYFMD